jgi:hypothetical protein
MPADWAVNHWPSCDFHVFLSHCAEDRNSLVKPVQTRLESSQVITWLDVHDYPAGRDPFEILREEILRCRHVVFFLTEAMLRQARGWSAVERSYAEVVQNTLTHGPLEVCHVELPLVFVRRDHSVLNRSIWAPLLPKAVFYSGRRHSLRDRIDWASETISEFVRREQQWGLEIGLRIEIDEELTERFGRDANLFDRVTATSIAPIGA